MWVLLEIENGEIVPSRYAKAAKDAGLDIITWTFERDGPLTNGGAWYFQTLNGQNPNPVSPDAVINNDGDMYQALDVLAQDVGILGIFSDWPATVTYYANCMKLK
jgi:glycerophosphoryl diester phosphodiesterase